jgi:uncharacterized protein YjbI with pentapeptide repeats
LLAGADVSETDLSSMDFSGCSLEHAKLQRVTAVGTSFAEATLHGCDFGGANLTRCDFGGADLRDAKLRYANVSEIVAGAPPRLAGADLRGITVLRSADATILERAVVTDPDGEEAWRIAALRAIRTSRGRDTAGTARPGEERGA